MPDPVIMEARGRALRALANDVESVADRVLATATSPGWSCPHAEDVRAALREERGKARFAAAALRDEASAVELAAGREREAQRERDAEQTPVEQRGRLMF